MSAIRAERDYVIHEDFMKVRLKQLILDYLGGSTKELSPFSFLSPLVDFKFKLHYRIHLEMYS